MKLSTLADQPELADIEITGMTADSRAVEAGFLFAALPGEKADGALFIPQAAEKGAAAVLARPGAQTDLPLIEDDNPRQRLALMAARFYPSQPEIIAGVTGTNGKTSVAHFCAQLWRMLGRRGGSLGTLGADAPGLSFPGSLTTPEPVSLHKMLNEMGEAGVDRLAMEVSSHAISQSRADGVRFRVAGFTNITQDHLDYHGTFEHYFDAKKRLFTELVSADGIAVINADGAGADEVESVCAARGVRVISTGAEGRDIALRAALPSATGIQLSVEAGDHAFDIHLPLIGGFQAENALVAAGIVIASGEEAHDVLPLLSRLAGAPGRMELAASIGEAGVFVDYAHTPDAVATALRAIRPHARGRVIAIIGAGGDRDKDKRPKMGEAATMGADLVIVTDDNPRTEDAGAIRAAVLSGCNGAQEFGDRAEAISHGVNLLQPGDALLIMGKGHETGQQVGREILPFNDVEAAKAAAAERQKLGS